MSVKTLINVYAGRYGYCDFVRGTAWLAVLMGDICEVTWNVRTGLRTLLQDPGPDRTGVSAPVDLDDRALTGETIRQRLVDRFRNHERIEVYCSRYTSDYSFRDRLRDLFQLRNEYRSDFQRFFCETTQNTPYTVVHCRLGDYELRRRNDGQGKGYISEFARWPESYRRHFEQIEFNMTNRDESRRKMYRFCKDEIMRRVSFLNAKTGSATVLLSDDADFIAFARREIPSLVTTNTRPVHTAMTSDVSLLKTTFYDLVLMTRAQRIVSITSLPWGGSGFSWVPAQVFSIPISTVKIPPEVWC